jgi:imidazolonepropionase
MILIGPFSQLLTMRKLPISGSLKDDQLEVIQEAGIIIDKGVVVKIGSYKDLDAPQKKEISFPCVALPGLIDAHTHLCWAGSRARDYSLRVGGMTYMEIAKRGGGILNTVAATRKATMQELLDSILVRLDCQLREGVTTCEVKSGYGLTVADEIKMLKTIQHAAKIHPIEIISTCLAAHTCPPEFSIPSDYLAHLKEHLFPVLKPLTSRIDIFIEDGAFSSYDALPYLREAKRQGFSLTVHANQFTHGGAAIAAQVDALSADHLEHITDEECGILKEKNVAAVALPGASLGLGVPMPPARKMLDHGLSLAIASDWNPGSAPMGHLLTQAAILGASEKLSLAETLAGITMRAAIALNLRDRGIIDSGTRCDLTLFPTSDWREILYYQGSLRPCETLIMGETVMQNDKEIG